MAHTGVGRTAVEPVASEPRLFVGQVPVHQSADDLMPLFTPFGTIKSLQLLKKPDGRSAGCAMVLYQRWAEAEAAMEAHNGTTVLEGGNGRPLVVHFANPRRGGPGQPQEQGIAPKKLFVGQVPRLATEADLRPLFEPFGFVENITLLKSQKANSAGCAFVLFAKWAYAEAAMEHLNGYKLTETDPPLVVKFADAKRKEGAQQPPVVGQKRGTELEHNGIAKRRSFGHEVGLNTGASLLHMGGGFGNGTDFSAAYANLDYGIGANVGLGGVSGVNTLGGNYLGLNHSAGLYGSGANNGLGGGQSIHPAALGLPDTLDLGPTVTSSYQSAGSMDSHGFGGQDNGYSNGIAGMSGAYQAGLPSLTHMQGPMGDGLDGVGSRLGALGGGMEGLGGLNGLGHGLGAQYGGDLHNGYTLGAGLQGAANPVPQGQYPRLGRGITDEAVNAWKLFIGQVPVEATEHDLWPIFASIGDILELYILRNNQGRSRGCAFVTYANKYLAQSAIHTLNGRQVQGGKSLVVKFADRSQPNKY